MIKVKVWVIQHWTGQKGVNEWRIYLGSHEWMGETYIRSVTRDHWSVSGHLIIQSTVQRNELIRLQGNANRWHCGRHNLFIYDQRRNLGLLSRLLWRFIVAHIQHDRAVAAVLVPFADAWHSYLINHPRQYTMEFHEWQKCFGIHRMTFR